MTSPEKQTIIRYQFAVVIIGAFLVLAKFVAYTLTHSNTIFTDALESIINVVAGVFALYSLYLAAKPKDADHPYGHGKVEFISAGFEGILIATAGVSLIVKSIVDFFDPVELAHLDVGMAIVALSGIINFAMGFFIEKTGKKYHSLTLIADGQHLKTDAYSSVGVIVGLVIILLTGWQVLDSIIAILFGVFIGYTGIKLIRKSIAGIMDEADEKLIEEIIALLNNHRKINWIDIHNLRVIQYGSILHIDCHATLPWYYTLETAHNEIEEIAAIINEKYGRQVEFFIHGDPCLPSSCKICQISNCKVRKEVFVEKIVWDLANVRRNQKHGL